ncbi:MAG TPA: hypothetical protein VLZ78_05315 [Terrimesophilobacter sp.]|nr:hypothetical protein [Terrimesophilobacter sp.]
MTEIVVATISAVALIVVAVINVGLRRRVKSIQGQVQNDHATNLREELDDRHDETRDWFKDLRRDIGGMREDFRWMRAELSAQSNRIHTIEQRNKP